MASMGSCLGVHRVPTLLISTKRRTRLVSHGFLLPSLASVNFDHVEPWERLKNNLGIFHLGMIPPCCGVILAPWFHGFMEPNRNNSACTLFTLYCVSHVPVRPYFHIVSCWSLWLLRKTPAASAGCTSKMVSGVLTMSSSTLWRSRLGAVTVDSQHTCSLKMLLPAAFAVAPRADILQETRRRTLHHVHHHHQYPLWGRPSTPRTTRNHSGGRSLRGNWEIWDWSWR